MGVKERHENGSTAWPLKLGGGLLSLIVAPIIVAVILHHMGIGGGSSAADTRSENAPISTERVASPDSASPQTKPTPPSREKHPGATKSGEDRLPETTPSFKDVVLDKALARYFQSNPLLMDVTGVKVIRLDKERIVVLAVASTPLKDNSGAERVRAEKVCRLKATASLVAEKTGIQVAHVEVLKEKTRVVLDNSSEKAQSVSELLQTTRTKVEGLAREMPVVGRWKSKEGDVFYLALGAICDKEGNPLPQEQEK